jgi:RNA polymerase sigma-70 factor (ECF subfamily)
MGVPGDPDLIARARTGDKDAFEHLLRPVIEPAARLAYGMLLDRAAAEDVVQEAALKAWRRLGNIRPGANFRPWFLGIVVNQSRSLRRSASWSVLRLDRVARDHAGQAADDATIRGADLRRAILRTAPDQRAAILLHFYLDLSLEDVADTLEISVAGVKSRINRGLRRMRPALASYEAVL